MVICTTALSRQVRNYNGITRFCNPFFVEKNNELSEDFLHTVGAQISDLHSGIVCHKAVLLWLNPALHLSCQI